MHTIKKKMLMPDDEWIAMDDFHLIMAESFHPFKDSANVDPARKNALILASAAAQWLASPLSLTASIAK